MVAHVKEGAWREELQVIQDLNINILPDPTVMLIIVLH